jgi:Flp pilus assembly pilin Flp
MPVRAGGGHGHEYMPMPKRKMEPTMLKRIREKLKALHKDESGAMSVEKVMIIALIALPIIIALWLFRKKLVTWFDDQSQDLQP